MADIKVRVGQQNAVKVISSISGSAGGRAVYAENVVGGIASVTSLVVNGISTFNGLTTFRYDTYALNFYATNIRSNNLTITGITSFSGGGNFVFSNSNPNSLAYFNNLGFLTSTQSPGNGINYTNSIATTDDMGIPTWSSTIDGGDY